MKEELKIDNEQIKFKLKVINTRTLSYPHLSVTKSDLFGWEVGDIISKNGNIFYKIISIKRGEISDTDIAALMGRMSRCMSYPKFKPLLEEYKKNGNFGVCNIYAKCVLRGSTEIIRGGIISISEFEQIKEITYYPYEKVNLDQVISNRDCSINILQYRIDRYQKKIDKQKDIKRALINLRAKVESETNIAA